MEPRISVLYSSLAQISTNAPTDQKVIHKQDIQNLRSDVKKVKVSLDRFLKQMTNSHAIFRPGENETKSVLKKINNLSVKIKENKVKLDNSTYTHHAYKQKSLDKMEAKIESYANKITTEYKKENVRNEFDIYIRDVREELTTDASAAKAIKQQNAKAGIFEYNGGMVR